MSLFSSPIDLSDLFAPIHKITPSEIKKSLDIIGFSNDSIINDGYLVIIPL